MFVRIYACNRAEYFVVCELMCLVACIVWLCACLFLFALIMWPCVFCVFVSSFDCLFAFVDVDGFVCFA